MLVPGVNSGKTDFVFDRIIVFLVCDVSWNCYHQFAGFFQTIANDSTFSALPSYCQHKLISLLPKCDKVTSENGKLR